MPGIWILSWEYKEEWLSLCLHRIIRIYFDKQNEEMDEKGICVIAGTDSILIVLPFPAFSAVLRTRKKKRGRAELMLFGGRK